MRFHEYNNFLTTQLSFQEIEDILGSESHQQLISHFKDHSDEMIRPAVFVAEKSLNKEAYDIAMNSLVVCKQNKTFDVIVYTCDGKQPYRKGNYFVKNGRGYLAYTGLVQIEDYDLSGMEVLKDVLTNEGVIFSV